MPQTDRLNFVANMQLQHVGIVTLASDTAFFSKALEMFKPRFLAPGKLADSAHESSDTAILGHCMAQVLPGPDETLH